MTNKFSNKVALVTGASSGLGKEIACPSCDSLQH
jgi:NAD(P)-dependent dehydrogenase (short-subunit alcohol dehydrogenase family)